MQLQPPNWPTGLNINITHCWSHHYRPLSILYRLLLCRSLSCARLFPQRPQTFTPSLFCPSTLSPLVETTFLSPPLTPPPAPSHGRRVENCVSSSLATVDLRSALCAFIFSSLDCGEQKWNLTQEHVCPCVWGGGMKSDCLGFGCVLFISVLAHE